MIDRIRELVAQGRFTVKSHVIRHMLEEGFERNHCADAVLNGHILEEYPEEQRCLIVGTFDWTETVTDHLHVVVDFSDSEWLDSVTAYMPRTPFWIAPERRG